MISKHFLLNFIFLIAMTSCQPATGIEEDTIHPSSIPMQRTTESPIISGSNFDHLTQLAISDLAQRLKSDPQLVTIIEAQPVTWSDASLGCPQPGTIYTQNITPGLRVILAAAGKQYEYHTDISHSVVLCEKDNTSTVVSPSTPIILGEETILTPVSGNLASLVDTSKEDLARRLEITPDEIEVLHIEKAEWSDTSLGCAKPGLTRRFIAIPGYRIILSANGLNHAYHTNKESGIVYCPKDKGR